MEIEFLKQRAKEFYETAKYLFQKEKYNLCAFCLEQSVQLFIKYLIGKKVGDWPKTHYLSELILQLSKAYGCQEIEEFYKNKELFFDALEDAYFTSRYFPKKFTKEKTEELFKGIKELFELFEEKLNEKI